MLIFLQWKNLLSFKLKWNIHQRIILKAKYLWRFLSSPPCLTLVTVFPVLKLYISFSLTYPWCYTFLCTCNRIKRVLDFFYRNIQNRSFYSLSDTFLQLLAKYCKQIQSVVANFVVSYFSQILSKWTHWQI